MRLEIQCVVSKQSFDIGNIGLYFLKWIFKGHFKNLCWETYVSNPRIIFPISNNCFDTTFFVSNIISMFPIVCFQSTLLPMNVLRVVQTLAVLFLKSMSERVGLTLNSNDPTLNRFWVDLEIEFQNRSLSDPTFSDIDFKDKMAWVCTSLKTEYLIERFLKFTLQI